MYQQVDGSVVTYTANTQARAYDYNLSQLPNGGIGYGVAVQPVYTDATPAHKTFVAANVTVLADTITITAHGFFTGLKVALAGTNLPAGLSATDYWVIVVNANTIKLASSLVLALAGTPVDITTQGTTADADLTPATLSQVVKLQMSVDGTNFEDISGKTVTVSSGGTKVWDLQFPCYKYVRVVVTPTGGAMTLVINFNAINLS